MQKSQKSKKIEKQGRTRVLKGNDIHLVDLYLSAYENQSFVARWEQD